MLIGQFDTNKPIRFRVTIRYSGKKPVQFQQNKLKTTFRFLSDVLRILFSRWFLGIVNLTLHYGIFFSNY